MHALAPFPVVIPLLMAALLAAAGSYIPRRLLDTATFLTSIAVLIICCLLAHASSLGTIVYWFGNWRPDPLPSLPHHFPVGVCFVIDPIGAGLAAMVALLTTAAFAFSWSYFEEVKSLYHALMLTFMAAMCGLCLTGDLFNLFVWFELMTAAAVALCGYKSEESWPLLGALSFAVVNTVGAFLSLAGVALLYARTGSLNMAEVGRSLAYHPPGASFLLVCFLFVVAGFLVKMAVVPFQFWLADAHAVAPTPVCVLFSGVMVELGLYAVARLHWLVFAPTLSAAAENAVRNVFLFIGIATAGTGAVYCFSQRHLKRMLAFSTVCHLGLMVIGFALLDPGALGGTAVYLVGHGMIKGALFLCAGILLHRCGSVDEYDLRGSGSNLKLLGILLVVAAFALAGMPPFATFYGQSEIHEAAIRMHVEWLPPIAIIAEALTAGAVLRFTARVFLGWGARHEATSRGSPHIPMDTETAGQRDKTPVWMWLPALLLLISASLVAIPHQFRGDVATAAQRFEQPQRFAAATLDATQDISLATATVPPSAFRTENFITILVALCLAGLSLFPAILGTRLNWSLGRGLTAAMRPLRKLQSGNVGDYVACFVFGIAAYGALLLVLARIYKQPQG
jgi:multicomponent Na+:H+ antiporter subunit D